MAKHIVLCRTCKTKFDAQKEDENITWVMKSRNWYYHKKCYEDWKSSKTHTNEEWQEMIFDLIARDLKGSYVFKMVENQINKFVSQGMTCKGIYYTLYWHFIIKKNPWKGEYGIGLVPHIYGESTNYWLERQEKVENILTQIEDMHKYKMATEPIVIKASDMRRTTKKKIKAPE